MGKPRKTGPGTFRPEKKHARLPLPSAETLPPTLGTEAGSGSVGRSDLRGAIDGGWSRRAAPRRPRGLERLSSLKALG